MNNSIITHFNRGASHYSDTARIQKRIALHLLDLVMQDLYSGRSFPADIQKKTFKSCLDLGCGPGVNFAELIQIADKVTGIDIAEEMIAKASKLDIAGTTAVNGNIENTELDGTFDLIYSSLAMQWCNLETAFNEIKRLTTEGKNTHRNVCLGISIPVSGTLQELRQAFRTIKGKERINSFFSPDDIKEKVNRCIFNGLKVTIDNFTDSYTDISNYLGSIRNIGANCTTIHQPLTRSEYNDLIEYLTDELYERGKLTNTYSIAFIYGTI